MKIFYLTALLLSSFTTSASAGSCKCKGDGCVSTTVSSAIDSDQACAAYCASDEGCPGGTYEYSDEACISGSTLLYSCAKGSYVPARDISLGDKIHATAQGTGKSTCTEVYHVYQHDEKESKTGTFAAVAITLVGNANDDESRSDDHHVLEVAPNHLVYVGESLENRRAVRASSVVPGDALLTMNGSMVVESVKTIPVTDLVNILTYEPAIHVGRTTDDGKNPVIISAYSYDEFYYHYMFATPLRFWYNIFGNYFESAQVNAMKLADDFIAQPLLRGRVN